ncbi:MAG: hypothetical protein A3I88_00080 [Candidatus Portnoybacteria bacterium RIFCSPLOWO2_12_FULL_39_9]|uniref:Uncharacterized protein n=1 Tax=Candidatus Portnoybacteria bacterium RIFCSPHIGHO2_12_FULL_38_9 TaxID=1801997 RepID=A0A1G2FHW6_9BACT|nr:MAG: hypothetical protein A3H00_00415 [Candidatus Portnoybacteria bacterium RBG_13_40_8]OGZ37005.1 MAG: hypothetical protein A2646_00730 [Candidatus Portnoybacteria bacterium RIFCSPHIGHO2_02_FULL_39_12]OGZ37636.1 MAG: hypothetical protein A3J64_00040 [Candidatus Portnoybacteria bacterium RIFCSPHIGHO2_12_FULL_38_9]OGZ39300.1 MAG: hypothetical protein A3F21_02385 [Candidatus Portnoybacteria bacterium RIFCSPLOWO2_01_FULL_38_39]OGZ39649.1 MAG: hypothetical protein A3I88_00080 [Candidatus Portnoy
MDFLEKLQNQPKHIRVQILWVSVAVCMFVIISLWVVSLKYSLSVNVEKSQTAENVSLPAQEIKKEIPSLMENLKASLGTFFEEKVEESTEETEQNVGQKQENTKDNEQKIKPAKLPVR